MHSSIKFYNNFILPFLLTGASSIKEIIRKTKKQFCLVLINARIVKMYNSCTSAVDMYGDLVLHLQNTMRLHRSRRSKQYGVSQLKKRVREKSRECHNKKPQPFLDTKRKMKQTKPNKRKSNNRTTSTKISSKTPMLIIYHKT